MKKMRRTPRFYDGPAVTTHQLSDLLGGMFVSIGERYRERPDLILAAWPQVIGPKLASMTQALSFVDGVLIVKVNNSTLYTLLSRHEHQRLLQTLRCHFPKIEFKNIQFKIG